MTAAAVWAEVEANYPAATLLPLTNIRDRSASTVDDTYGTQAAQHALDLWDMYAEITFDSSNATHLAVAVHATMAVLYRQNGTDSTTAGKKWDEVFGDSGMMAKLRRTTARGRQSPYTSGPDLDSSGRQRRNWSNRNAMPKGFLPDSQAKEWYD